MEQIVEQAYAQDPGTIARIVDLLRPYLTPSTSFVPVGSDPEIYGPSDRDRAMVVHLHNSVSIKTLNWDEMAIPATDGRYDSNADVMPRPFRAADGTTKLRRVEDFNYILVENAFDKDGFREIRYTIYVRGEQLFRRLREAAGLK